MSTVLSPTVPTMPQSKPNQAPMLEDQENHEPALKELCGTCTITACWGCEMFIYTKHIVDETGNGQVEFAFTLNPQTGWITFGFDICCFEGHRPFQAEDFNMAFYRHLLDGSPAFGDRPDNQFMQHKHADLPEDRSSPHIWTISNS